MGYSAREGCGGPNLKVPISRAGAAVTVNISPAFTDAREGIGLVAVGNTRLVGVDGAAPVSSTGCGGAAVVDR